MKLEKEEIKQNLEDTNKKQQGPQKNKVKYPLKKSTRNKKDYTESQKFARKSDKIKRIYTPTIGKSKPTPNKTEFRTDKKGL